METRRTFFKGKRQYRIFWDVDETPDLSSLQQTYADESLADRRKYLAQDKKRLDALNNQEWEYRTMGCEISIGTAARWNCPMIIGRSFLGQIESDSDPSFLTEVEDDLIHWAEEDAALTLQAILADDGLLLSSAANLIPCLCHKANAACPANRCECIRGKVKALAVANRLSA